MEQNQVAALLPMAVFCCIFLVLAIGFVVLVVFLLRKSKESSWEGKVVEKKIDVHTDMDTDLESNYYKLIVELKDGNRKNVGVGKKLYDEFEVGNNIRKDQGEYHPKKVI